MKPCNKKICACMIATVFLLSACSVPGRNSSDTVEKVLDKYAPYPSVTPEDFVSNQDVFEVSPTEMAAKEIELVANASGSSNPENTLRLYENVTNEVIFYEDLAYKGVIGNSNNANKFDICSPNIPIEERGEGLPFILFLSGGKWTTSNKMTMRTQVITMAHHGYVSAAINTRTMPNFGYREQLEDIMDAIKYFHDSAEELGIDPDKIFLMGGSSGGNMALMAAYTNGLGFAPSFKQKTYIFNIRGVCAYAPPILLEESSKFIMDGAEDPENYELVQTLLGVKSENLLEGFAKINPSKYVTENSPPTLVIQGLRDEIVSNRDGRELFRILRENNVKSDLIEYPNADHVYWQFERMLKDADDFFQSCLDEEPID